MHAWARARRLRVDAEDFRVRAIGAEKIAVELARKIPVGGIAAPAGQQALVSVSLSVGVALLVSGAVRLLLEGVRVFSA